MHATIRAARRGGEAAPETAEALLRLEAASEVAPLRLEAALPAPIRLVEVAAVPLRLVPVFRPAATREDQAVAATVAPPTVPDPPDAPWTGAQLRRAREVRGFTAAALAQRLKVTCSLVESLEAERRDHLPPPVYLRGLLSAVAKELQLDVDAVVRSYPGAARAERPAR